MDVLNSPAMSQSAVPFNFQDRSEICQMYIINMHLQYHCHGIDCSLFGSQYCHGESMPATVSYTANVAMLTGIARSIVGLSPRKKTPAPPVRYECWIVDMVVRYGLSLVVTSDRIMLRASAVSVLCMRVFTTSIGNVGSQPRMPATPPLTNSTQRGMDPWLESDDEVVPLNPGEGVVRYRLVASYLPVDVNPW